MSRDTSAAMQLRVVGCGDAFGSGGRRQACFLLDGPSGRVLLDCGPSSLSGLQELEVPPASVDAVLVSHLHGDHFAGIPFLFLDHRYRDARTSTLHLAGPPELGDRLDELGRCLYASGAARAGDAPVELHPLTPGIARDVGPARVDPFAVEHDPGELCLGFRVEMDGRSVVYSGDTRWFDGLADHARGADLFLLECTYVDEEGGAHMRVEDLLRHRERLDVGRLLLVHLGPSVLENRHRHALPWAEDGMSLTL